LPCSIKKKLKKYVIWVVRRNSNGELRDSAPCNECCLALQKLGFRKIGYSISDGGMEIADLRYYTNSHISNSQNEMRKYSISV